MQKMTFFRVAEKTLEQVNEPLSPRQIWKKAEELGLTKDLITKSKTPVNSIGAYIYTDINNNREKSTFIRTNERPAKFFLRKRENMLDTSKSKVEENEEKESNGLNRVRERDLHPLIVAFLNSNPHFSAQVQTIYHETSKKEKKGRNKWMHPDLVGVFFPFEKYGDDTLEAQKQMRVSSIKLFSFEAKIDLSYPNLRENYFQAVSNSSWANEGYLIALNIEEDSDFRDELRMLNDAFGIGIIQLDAENPQDSTILFQSRIRQDLDWNTIDRIARDNTNFGKFLKNISEDISLGRIKSEYDRVLNEEEIEDYIKGKWGKAKNA